MEGSKINDVITENGCSSEGLPPNPFAASYHHRCLTAARTCHPSLEMLKTSEVSIEQVSSNAGCGTDFIPLVRSGAWTDIGFRRSMEDAYICVDNFMSEFGLTQLNDGPYAFYGVFDGHGGKHAADFACYHLLRFIVEDHDFPSEIERVVASAFLQTDTAFAEACSLDAALDSGTTALAALVLGRSLVVANVGDCRAVLSRRGKAIEMSRDHKPLSAPERARIERSGGYVFDGYLNGQLNCSRALGDWHMEGLKSPVGGPLSAVPELMTTRLTREDEFLIIGCDGLWDVFRSQNAVDFARRKLREHNDPGTCCRELVEEALKRMSGDNVAVVVVCFQEGAPERAAASDFRRGVHRSISSEGLRELQAFFDGL